ncbi:MAG: DNA-binding protein, partial [Alphaproteobacteria bacterium HGW-Alphaproteobacteria-10]
MKKSELIEALEGASGQSKASVTAVLDALPGVLVAALREHKALTVPGVGKFEAKVRGAR